MRYAMIYNESQTQRCRIIALGVGRSWALCLEISNCEHQILTPEVKNFAAFRSNRGVTRRKSTCRLNRVGIYHFAKDSRSNYE